MARRVPTPFAIERYTKELVPYLLKHAQEIGIVDDVADYEDMIYEFPHSRAGEAGVDYGKTLYDGMELQDWLDVALEGYDDPENVPPEVIQALGKTQRAIPLQGFMKIGTKSWTDTVFIEYEQFATDPEIGSVRSNDWEVIYGAFVAHELAHVVDYMEYVLPGKDSEEEGHGIVWQGIYRLFRRHLGLVTG